MSGRGAPRGERLGREVGLTGLQAAATPGLREGHAIALLEGGAEFFPALEADIDAARLEIHLETYIVHDDASARRIVAALVRAAGRGVAVRLAIDGYGTPRVPAAISAMLAGTTAQLRVFRPERDAQPLDRRRLRRLHRKLVVIDARVAFVGGINLLDDLVDPNHGTLDRPRLDFAVRVEGPLVDDARHAVRRLWDRLEPRRLRRVLPVCAARRSAAQGHESRAAAAAAAKPAPARGAARPTPHAGAHGPAHAPKHAPPHDVARGRRRGAGVYDGLRAMLLLRDNFRHRRAIEREYLDAIAAARHDILIANAYFFPGVRMRQALVRAATRGVRVTLLLQGRVEYRLQHYATQALYDELLAAGVTVVEYASSFLHAKVAVADDWATVGSSNIDPFSLLLAREANVVVRDEAFAAHLAGRIRAAIAHGGHPVLAHRHARRALPVRLANWAAFALLRAGVALSGRATRW
jgi:cardiolipin synthase